MPMRPSFDLLKTKSYNATVSLVNSQYCFVKLDANGQIILAGNGQGGVIGVLQDKPDANDPGAVCFPGDITKVQCGGTFAAGSPIQSDASGKAVAAVSGSFVLGEAITAGGANELAVITFQPRGSKL